MTGEVRFTKLDAWKPLKQNARGASMALGGYVLVVSAILTLMELGGADPGADGFAFVVLGGVAAAGGWIALGLLYNLRALWLTRGERS